ncbi:MAG: SusC/RagA family TonB-linked outer membrane protein, partial [Bacteroidota bacterium]|nr:SusC/RagA family TonB-linked outer membrane protein [Bacteroidota bacterium]
MRKLLMLMLGVLLVSTHVLAQNRAISGRIANELGEGIANASVSVKGTTNGTVTNANGNFTLNVGSAARTLVVSSVGFQTKEISIDNKTTYDVKLMSDPQNMNEVVVVAYGTVKKGENTASTTQITADKFKNRPITNISSVLEGAAPGIQTLSANGQPGSSQSVRIRGFGSINASNDPLYVVDGVVYSGGLSNFNMDDVESVSVLKDAASTALYGSRGANGVIIITTKKGKKNRNAISFRMTQGISERALPEYDRVDAYQYYPLMWQAYRNSLVYGTTPIPIADANRIASGLLPRFTTGSNRGRQNYNGTAYNDISQNLTYNPFNVPTTEIVLPDGTLNPNAKLLWADDLNWNRELERKGHRQEYTVNYSGGNDKTDFFSSFGFVDEKGFIIRSDQKRFLGRLNINSQPISWFRTGLNISGTVTASNQASDGSSTGYVNPFFFTRQMGPIYPMYAHDPATGAYMLNTQGQRFYDYGNLSAMGIPNRPAGASAGRHILEETRLNQSRYNRNIASGRAYGEVLFTKDLKATTNISLDLTNYFGSTYDNNLVGDGAPAGRASKNTTLTRSYTFNQLLNYAKRFGMHNLSVLAGHENYDLHIEDFSASRQGQVVAGNYDLENFTTTNGVSSQTDKHRIESYLSRVNYDFDGKYFVSGSFRRDGNSRFHKSFRWENFWSIGGAWRLDREAFMQNTPWVNALKLRASYGRVGNDAG